MHVSNAAGLAKSRGLCELDDAGHGVLRRLQACKAVLSRAQTGSSETRPRSQRRSAKTFKIPYTALCSMRCCHGVAY